MPGTLSSAASLTLCLAAANAFMVRPSKVSPPSESAWTKKPPASFMAPAKAGSPLGIGTLGGIDGSEAVEAGKRRPLLPSAEGYTVSCRRGFFPLHAAQGLEPDITQDGNTTIPIIVGGVGDEESDVASVPEGEGVETASTSHAKDDGSTHDNADIAIQDAGFERLNQQEMSREDSSDANNEESLAGMADDIDLDEDLLFDLAAAVVFDEMGLGPFDSTMLDDVMSDIDHDDGRPADVVEAVHHEIGSMLHNSDGSVFGGEQPLDLTDADGVVDGIRLGLFGPVIPRSAVDAEMASMPVDDAVDDDMPYILRDGMFDGVASKGMVLDDAVHDLIRFVVSESLAEGDSADLMLDDAMDKLMWFKLHHAISGQVACEPVNIEGILDDVLTSMLHKTLFGPTASKAVSSLTENAGVSGLVVEDYVQTVSELYDKFEGARDRRTDDAAFNAEFPLELTIDGVADNAVDDSMRFVLQDSDDSSAFDGEWLFELDNDNDGVINGMDLWPFGPALLQELIDDETPPMLREAMSDGAASKAVKVLVWSVLDNAFTQGAEFDDLMIDDDTDEQLWIKLHDAISVSERAAIEPANLEDVFDDVLTSLLHRVFFGAVASKAVESLTKTGKDSELLVTAYVRAVAQFYDEFKETRSRNRHPDSY